MKDNTLIWIAAIGVGVYFLSKRNNSPVYQAPPVTNYNPVNTQPSLSASILPIVSQLATTVKGLFQNNNSGQSADMIVLPDQTQQSIDQLTNPLQTIDILGS